MCKQNLRILDSFHMEINKVHTGTDSYIRIWVLGMNVLWYASDDAMRTIFLNRYLMKSKGQVRNIKNANYLSSEREINFGQS